MDAQTWQDIGDEVEIRTRDVALTVAEYSDGGLELELAPRHDGQEVVVEAEPHGRWTRLHVTSKAVA